MRGTLLAFGALLAATVLTQSGAAEEMAQVRTLVAAPVRITALAQDGRRIAWLQPGLKRRVGIRDLVKRRSVFVPRHKYQTDTGEAVPLPVIALAGNRAVYVLYEQHGNTEEDFIIVTTSVGDRTERFVGLETQGNCPCFGPLPTWPLAADGGRALFVLRGGVYRVAGRRAVRVQGRRVGDHLAVSELRYASAWLYSPGGCICAASPTWAPDGSRIAFDSRVGLSFSESPSPRIAIVPTTGGKAVEVAPGSRPDWSPDGSLIAFQRGSPGEAVYVMRPDGTQVRRVLTGADPDWHPNGTTLAFVRNGVIHVGALDGSGVRRITEGASPTWSPDGRRLAYTRGGDLYVVNGDGTGAARLTSHPDDDFYDVDPSWSPDGRHIAYARHVVLHATGELTDTRLRVIRADGTEERQLGVGRALGPVWSPDGSRLAYAGWLPRRHPATGAPSTEIFSSAPDGSGLFRVTNTEIRQPVSAGFVRTLTKPRRSTGLRITGVVRGLALSSAAVALLAEDMHGTRLVVLHPRTGRVLQRVIVPDNARMLSAAGRNVVFALGREIKLFRVGQREPRTIAVTSVTPVGLSIEGRRVAWIENRGRRGLIRALNVRG